MLTLLKRLTFITLLSCLPWVASASLITTSFDQLNYLQDDIVAMDIYLNSANPEMIWLDFDIEFDDTKLQFNYFDFDSNVISNSLYTDAFDFFGLGPLTVSVGFDNNWYSSLSNVFKLGTANFLALADYSPEVNIGYLSTSNIYGDSIPSQVLSKTVPEPTSFSIFAFALLMTLISAKKRLFKVKN